MFKKFCGTIAIIGLVATLPLGVDSKIENQIFQASETPREYMPQQIVKINKQAPLSNAEIMTVGKQEPETKSEITELITESENAEKTETLENISPPQDNIEEFNNKGPIKLPKNPEQAIGENISGKNTTQESLPALKSGTEKKTITKNPSTEAPLSLHEKSSPKPVAEKQPSKKVSLKHYGNRTTLKAGEESTTIATVKGVGTVPIIVTRDSNSAAPNLPTYISVVCGNEGPYSGAFNTLKGETVVKNITFNGDCKIKAKISYPSDNWKGTHNSVSISTGSPSQLSGEPFTTTAKWATKAVTKQSDFSVDTPKNFKGNLVLKMTGCSTRGGATDATKKFACDGHVQKKTGSKGVIEVLNNGKVVAKQSFNITYEKHHETLTVPVNTTKPGTIIRITKTSGAPVLLHGPNVKAVGTH